MIFGRKDPLPASPKYPGIPAAVDGTTAVVEVETAASEGAGFGMGSGCHVFADGFNGS